MISLIEHTCVDQKQWITPDEMMNLTVIAESTPGPVAINCATYVGYKRGKLPGALAATFGVVLPSFVIIYMISVFLDDFLEITWVANAFRGIKLAVGILILDAALKMLKQTEKGPLQKGTVLCATAALMIINLFSLKISSVILMICAALIGILRLIIKDPAGKEKTGE